MGEEIKYTRYNKSDYQRFYSELEAETNLLERWFTDGRLSTAPLTAGYEIEAWLVDERCRPCPKNEEFLAHADNELLSPELARFNIELNVAPAEIRGKLLSHFESELSDLWHSCSDVAGKMGCDILGVGILPTLHDDDLTLDNISLLDRYKALNEQVLRQRKGVEIELNINGTEHLHVSHKDVMLEAAATSLQIHIQVPRDVAARYYNASILLSPMMVAASANSPCLFGKRLWQESRIPVFEQSVPTGGFGGAAAGPVQRVGFGTDYVRDSIFECFQENLEHFPILLPAHYDEPPERLRHLRLHNGTIWRWNRPLIGFDSDGTPHLRIEHRVCAAAPSIADNIANMAFYYGLVHHYATADQPPERLVPFAQAKSDFYRAAQLGLRHSMTWMENRNRTIQHLILDEMLPAAEAGLHGLGIDESDSKHYLGIIEQRVSTAQTGSQWQLDFLNAHQDDRQLLTLNYLRNQQEGRPVHTWSTDS